MMSGMSNDFLEEHPQKNEYAQRLAVSLRFMFFMTSLSKKLHKK